MCVRERERDGELHLVVGVLGDAGEEGGRGGGTTRGVREKRKPIGEHRVTV